jgi:hypothetical protein
MAETGERVPVLRAAFLLTLIAGLGFAAHAGWRIVEHARGGFEARIEDWMSARHVIRVFGLPEDSLAPVLGGTAGSPLPYGPLRDLAAAQGKPPEALVAEVQAQVDALGDGP